MVFIKDQPEIIFKTVSRIKRRKVLIEIGYLVASVIVISKDLLSNKYQIDRCFEICGASFVENDYDLNL